MELGLIFLGLAFLIEFISERVGPQEYYYKEEIVVVYDKYQCPIGCGIKHNHYVYYDKNITGNYRIYINQGDLDKKNKKNSKKK